ncbi:MAG TPA: hypothetical protein VLE95_08125 [Chlamydiales bacterium]|nr:hypothetical protein [Chlamydiales bacterium]
MLAQQLEFDFAFGCASIEAEYYRDGAQDLIQRLVPPDLLEAKGISLASQRVRFADLLPMISWSDFSKAPSSISVLLLCKYRLNACHFFYDMISRWLLPQKRVNVELFFASDVRLPHLSDELLSVAEIVIYLKSAQDVEEAKRQSKAIETEIRLGVVSNYHARRILEFKGLSTDGKTAMIQEKIGSLIQSHSKDFDRGIFMQMQQFLVTCHPEFKNARDYHHISRIISNLYSLRKLLKQNIKAAGAKRHVSLKFLRTRIAGSKNAAEKPVLGILAGLNFLNDQERFEMQHLVSAIKKHLPDVSLVADSPFMEKEEMIQVLYLEIEKQGGEFTLEEIQRLRTVLPEQIKSGIERLAHPIFMPRNEEEVLRNIMTLSRQLRFVNDMPQAILSFDAQKGDELCFTIILARTIMEGDPAIQDLFASSSSGIRFFIDRVRRVGQLRRKYIKEAVVLRAAFPCLRFLRADRSIDFYKAREFVLNSVSDVIGEVRDFNGGMIHKQNELLSQLKASIGKLNEPQNLLIEKFFYSLMPMEMRSVLELEPLRQFALLLLQSKKTDLLQKKQDIKKAMVVTPLYDNAMKKRLTDNLEKLSMPIYQLISFQLDDGDAAFTGSLLLSEEKAVQNQFLSLFDC